MLPQQFLVPVDFSDMSQKALDFAIDLGRALQARLLLLHVIETPVLGGGPGGVGMATAYAEAMQQIEEEASQNLENAIRRGREAGLACAGEIKHGSPFQQILDAVEHQVEDQKSDLIVMGTHGHTGLKRFFLGSVAEKVVRLAACPVLVIPGDVRKDEA